MLNPKNLEYKILSKHHLQSIKNRKSYTDTYLRWKKNWKEIFESVGSPQAFVIDDFYRADVIPVLLYEGQIVAYICSTIFNVLNPCILDMRYFSIFTPQAQQWIKNHSPNSIMSMEFLTVDPRMRKSQTGVSLAEILIQLSFMSLSEHDIDMAVGVSVKMAGIEKLATNLAADVIGHDVKRGNLECNLLGQVRKNVLSAHPDPMTDKLIKRLWNTRETFDQFIEKKAA